MRRGFIDHLAVVFAAAPVPAAAEPNIALISADDIGCGDLSCDGATKVKTPNRDKPAAAGDRFGHASILPATGAPAPREEGPSKSQRRQVPVASTASAQDGPHRSSSRNHQQYGGLSGSPT